MTDTFVRPSCGTVFIGSSFLAYRRRKQHQVSPVRLQKLMLPPECIIKKQRAYFAEIEMEDNSEKEVDSETKQVMVDGEAEEAAEVDSETKEAVVDGKVEEAAERVPNMMKQISLRNNR